MPASGENYSLPLDLVAAASETLPFIFNVRCTEGPTKKWQSITKMFPEASGQSHPGHLLVLCVMGEKTQLGTHLTPDFNGVNSRLEIILEKKR